MRLYSLMVVVSFLLTGCFIPQPTHSAYGTLLYVEYSEPKRIDKLNMEIFLDDGRIFTVVGHRSSLPFMQGDRVLVEYKNLEAKKVYLIDSMPRMDLIDAN